MPWIEFGQAGVGLFPGVSPVLWQAVVGMRTSTFVIACILWAGSAPVRLQSGETQVKFEPRAAVWRVLGSSVNQQSATLALKDQSAGPSPCRSLSATGRAYLAALASLRHGPSATAGDPQVAQAGRQLLVREARSCGPVVFFTRYPLTRPNAAGCAIWQSLPERWGCSIRVYDPGHADAQARTIFEDPQGCIYDMNMSLDAATLFFSYRRRTEACWQIYEIGMDGQGLRRISRDSTCHDVGAVELPGGNLLFVSTRCGGRLVSEPGPRSNLWRMRRDGSQARCVSQNTVADFSPQLLPDGRVIFSRWEYVDRDLDYRQALWTQRPDGTLFQLFFGNTIRAVGLFWQARPVPGHDHVVVATFAPSTGRPYGAIGLGDQPARTRVGSRSGIRLAHRRVTRRG